MPIHPFEFWHNKSSLQKISRRDPVVVHDSAQSRRRCPVACRLPVSRTDCAATVAPRSCSRLYRVCLSCLPCGIIRAMKIESPSTATRNPSAPRMSLQDAELTIKAMRGIADIEAGHSASVADVRARVLSRYEPSRACV